MIVIYEEDGKTVYARGFKDEDEYLDYRYPDRLKTVRNIMTERNYSETKNAERVRERYKLQTKLDQQKKKSRGHEYYHNVVVPKKMGLEPYRPLGQKGRPSVNKPEPIRFHGKSKVAFI